jgi:hypothetical protein
LTALRGSAKGMIDATACTDRDWEAAHKVSPRAALRCRACAHPMHAKLSARGTGSSRTTARSRTAPQPEKPLFTGF